MSWKKLFKKFQESCLVHDHHLYLSGMKEAFLSHFWPDTSNQVSEPPCCLVSAQENIWFSRRSCFKNSKMVVLCMAIFDT